MKAFALRVGRRTITGQMDDDGVVRIDNEIVRVTRVSNGLYRVHDEQRQWTVAVAGEPDARWVFVDGQVAVVEVVSGASTTRRRTRGRAGDHDLSAPMPATVVLVHVAPGATVTRGDTLLTLEAMKMELAIRAPRDGTVQAVHCTAGDLVQPGVALLDLR